MTTVVHVLGARPNFVKMAPVVHALRARLPAVRQVLVHTGQHYDPGLWQIFVDELDLPQPDYVLGVGSAGHGAQTGRALERLEPVLERERPKLVVVAGDVNSTLAGALAAAKLEIPVAHVEAGLRSFDRTMPEEINRVLVDQISEWCFTHSAEADENLLREGIPRERIHFVGNTMIDTLVRLRARIEAARVHERLGLAHGRYVFVTLHRPKLVDGPLFREAMDALARLARTLPVVYPMHPRARTRLGRADAEPGLRLLEPVGYVESLALQLRAAAVVTDSGGVQEEATYLRVPCFTLRENTERPVTVTQGTNRILGIAPERIADVPRLLGEAPVPLSAPPAWDGRAAERVVDVLAPALRAADPERSAASARR